MAIVEINAERIDGPWADGFVLDRHVISSRPTGYLGEHMQFDTIRSALGELVYQLKYRGGPPDDIIETATAFVFKHWAGRIGFVVTPPPSLYRTRQPAMILGRGIAKRLGAVYKLAAVVKAEATQQMKNVPIQERGPLLSLAIQPGPI